MSRAEARKIAVLSGKGGVGKTNLVVNVAMSAAARGSRVLVVDGDLGLANVDVLLGLTPRTTSAQVIDGEQSFDEAIVEGPAGIHLLAAPSGRADLPGRRPAELARLLLPMLALDERYDLVLVDAGSGIGPSVMSLAATCNEALLVLTSEPTSLADAYATLKVLSQEAPALPVRVVVNEANTSNDAAESHSRLVRMSERFLGKRPPLTGWIPVDARLPHAVAKQRALVELFPSAPAARAFADIARTLTGDTPEQRSTAPPRRLPERRRGLSAGWRNPA